MGIRPLLLGLARSAARVEDLLLVLLLSAMIVLSGAQILLRNLWDAGFAWSDPLLRTAVLWLALLGAMAASRDHRHITVDALSRILPAGLRRVTQLATDLFTAVVCGFLSWHGARFVHLDWTDGVEALPGVPAWLVELIIPVGFGIIGLRYLLHAVFGRRDEAAAR